MENITNLNELSTIIEQLKNKEITFNDINFDLENFENELKTLTITFKGDAANGAISTSMMQPIIALQKNIHQQYADIHYNGNIRRLTPKDKQNLELFVKIEDGSVIIQILLSTLITKITDLKVTGGNVDQITVFTIVLLSLYASGSVYKAYTNKKAQAEKAKLDKKAKNEANEIERQKIAIEKLREENKSKELTIKQEELIQKQEERKMQHEENLLRINKESENFNRLIEKTSPATEIVNDIKQIKKSLNYSTEKFEKEIEDVTLPVFSAATKCDSVTIDDIVVDSDTATTLKENPRLTSIDVQLNDRYIIANVDSDIPGEFEIKLRNLDTGKELKARITEDDKTGIKDVIAKGEWGKKPIHLKINAKEKDGKIIKAVIISAEWLD